MPHITLKLFASLAKSSAENIAGEIKQITLLENDTINSLVERVNLADKNLHLVILNGVYINKEDRPTKRLNDGDILAIWPPIVGG
ncbi:MAG: molybdopterin converting factor, small subunit [Cycloclasticus sp. Phe_18]|jgi:sulfur carrier protein ThiS|nr:MAG: molybdopterin converting factor, small subunit [Cycloclasticus sp. Phe_18]MDF1689163.1 MoaD/ThiS family protein [Cycloclasticus sp.]